MFKEITIFARYVGENGGEEIGRLLVSADMRGRFTDIPGRDIILAMNDGRLIQGYISEEDLESLMPVPEDDVAL